MLPNPLSILRPTLTLSLLVAGTPGQQAGRPTGPPVDAGTRPLGDAIAAVVPGRILDLSLDLHGRILYCTQEGEVGRIDPGGATTVLAPQGTFNQEVRAVAATPTDDVAVIVSPGDIHVLVGGSLPAELRYDDTYMILDPTDLICDVAGTFLVASSSPSNGQRAINWISSDGIRWSYYVVENGPVQIAPDPLTGGLMVSDEQDGGVLRLVAPGDPTRPISLLEGDTLVGLQASVDDGDIALEHDGDVFWIAGNRVWFHDRSSGETTIRSEFQDTLRGAVIAPRSGNLLPLSPNSLYVAVGDDPTIVREIPGVDAPAIPLAIDQGWVPGSGIDTEVDAGFQVFEIAVDNSGDLLMGGGLFSTTFHLKRLLLPEKALIEIADDTDGLAGIIEGLVVAADDTIFAITREGVLQAITENPLSITTVFSDPLDDINAAKDLALGLDGRFYVAERAGWGFGGVWEIDPAAGFTATLIATMSESRGLAPNPAGGLYVSEWNGTGFEGSVGTLDLGTNDYATLPGFAGINYTNGPVWGDGDLLVDALGDVYSVSEDDWSLLRYTPGQTRFVRKGSGYLDHVSGLAIAPSSTGSGSTTGWSLYVSEWDELWERIDSPGPGPTLVDNSAGIRARRPRAAWKR